MTLLFVWYLVSPAHNVIVMLYKIYEDTQITVNGVMLCSPFDGLTICVLFYSNLLNDSRFQCRTPQNLVFLESMFPVMLRFVVVKALPHTQEYMRKVIKRNEQVTSVYVQRLAHNDLFF